MKKQEEVYVWETAIPTIVISAAIDVVCSQEVMSQILEKATSRLHELFGQQIPPEMDSVRVAYEEDEEGKTQIKKAEFISREQADAINGGGTQL